MRREQIPGKLSKVPSMRSRLARMRRETPARADLIKRLESELEVLDQVSFFYRREPLRRQDGPGGELRLASLMADNTRQAEIRPAAEGWVLEAMGASEGFEPAISATKKESVLQALEWIAEGVLPSSL